MTDTDGQFIQRLLREMQAEMRTIRSENALARRQLAETATREDLRAALSAIVETISDRIAQFEAMLEERLDRLERRP